MRFSVVIANYNSEKYIERCLKSIFKQTYTDYEIIVVDDMSQDNSPNLVKSLLREQDTLIINPTKRLNGGSRNVGINAASGDYIICIDNDDYFKDNTVFEEINNALNGDIDVLFLGYDTYWSREAVVPYFPENNDIMQGLQNCVCAPWTKVIKTKLMKETPFPEGTLFDDRIQHYKVLMKCKTFKNLPKVCVVWDRTNVQSASQQGVNYYRYEFNYAGDLFQLIREMDDCDLKQYYKQELTGYIKHINEMVGEL